VVVLYDFTGMSHDPRNQPTGRASEGDLAAAPDLSYWRQAALPAHEHA